MKTKYPFQILVTRSLPLVVPVKPTSRLSVTTRKRENVKSSFTEDARGTIIGLDHWMSVRTSVRLEEQVS